MKQPEWTDTLVHLLSLALRLEGEGQYNLAKIARARADSMSRRAAWELNLPSDKETLVRDIERLAASLDDAHLQTAFRGGASALTSGRLPLIREIPHPYVCRTCGYLTLGEVPEKCPDCGAWGGTFQWFAPVYWLEALDPTEALERLRKTPLEVAALIAGLTEDEMTRPPADGGWAIRNTVSHLRDAQNVIAARIDLFLHEENPVLEMKAVWTWARSENQRPPSTREVFDAYQTSRLEMIAKLEAIPCTDWRRTGRHEEFGVVSIKQQVSYFTAHELTHLPQIARLANFANEAKQ
ncbi:MAG TPA: DinB family protein [Anaerolineae bacterium]|nr:DinB family protein [Anaerolineae bacterium]HNU02762.1 DinB family protein [Anaerolineae bacterium]